MDFAQWITSDKIAAVSAMFSFISLLLTFGGLWYAWRQVKWAAAGTSVNNLVVQNDRIQTAFVAWVQAHKAKASDVGLCFGHFTNTLEIAAIAVIDGALTGQSKRNLIEFVTDIRHIIKQEPDLERMLFAHKSTSRTFEEFEKLVAEEERRRAGL